MMLITKLRCPDCKGRLRVNYIVDDDTLLMFCKNWCTLKEEVKPGGRTVSGRRFMRRPEGRVD